MTSVFSFGAALGITLEEEVLNYLNEQKRGIWNLGSRYNNYFFERQAGFPDIVFKNSIENIPLFGLELKSWYILSKEKEPSFRMRQTPNACGEADLVIVVPWALSNVLSGEPVVFEPYIESAKFLAEFRNYWWQYLRNTNDPPEKRQIESPKDATPYPPSRDKFVDKPIYDGGGNFGRIARTGIMDEYVRNILNHQLLGIRVESWIDFFLSQKSTHSEV